MSNKLKDISAELGPRIEGPSEWCKIYPEIKNLTQFNECGLGRLEEFPLDEGEKAKN